MSRSRELQARVKLMIIIILIMIIRAREWTFSLAVVLPSGALASAQTSKSPEQADNRRYKVGSLSLLTTSRERHRGATGLPITKRKYD